MIQTETELYRSHLCLILWRFITIQSGETNVGDDCGDFSHPKPQFFLLHCSISCLPFSLL